MGVFKRQARPSGSGGISSEKSLYSKIAEIVPENRQYIVREALRRLDVTVQNGSLKDAIETACGALVVRQEFSDSVTELDLASQALSSVRKHLGRSTYAFRHCEDITRELSEGERIERVADKSLELIQGVVNSEYGITEPMEAQEIFRQPVVDATTTSNQPAAHPVAV